MYICIHAHNTVYRITSYYVMLYCWNCIVNIGTPDPN